jgi:putative phage-type endonuclease
MARGLRPGHGGTAMLKDEQQAVRSKGIGASEVAAVVGLSPWQGPHDIWERKTGRAPPQTDNSAIIWGSIMEPAIISVWRARTGNRVRYTGRHQRTYVHPQNPLCVATPDGLIEPGGVNLEVKTYGSRVAHHWGEPGTDDIPEYYLAQCTWQMAASGRKRTLLLASHDRDIDEYHVLYDADFYSAMAEQVARFWRDYVETDTPPPADHRERCREILARYYPRPKGKECAPCTPEATELAMALRDAETAAKAAEERLALAKNRMAEHIGAEYGVHTEVGKVLWYPVAGRTTPSAKALRALAEQRGATEQEVEQCYSQAPDYRVLRAYWKK